MIPVSKMNLDFFGNLMVRVIIDLRPDRNNILVTLASVFQNRIDKNDDFPQEKLELTFGL